MRLEAIDKQMNIDHGGKTYQNQGGYVDVPDSVGTKFLEASRTGRREVVSKYTKSYSMGTSVSDEQWNKIFGK